MSKSALQQCALRAALQHVASVFAQPRAGVLNVQEIHGHNHVLEITPEDHLLASVRKSVALLRTHVGKHPSGATISM